MSDEAPDRVDAAVRAYIGAVAFCCVLIGAELMERGNVAVGGVLVIVGLPLYLSAAIWRLIKPKLDSAVLTSLNSIATDARWWVGLLLVILFGLAISPFLGAWTFLTYGLVTLAALLVAAIAIAPLLPSWNRARSVHEVEAAPSQSTFVDVDRFHSPTAMQTSYSTDRIHIADFYAENPLKLRSDRVIVFIVRVYNANEVEFAITGVSGAIHCSQSSGTPIQLLPVDLQNLMIGTDSEGTLQPFKEARLVLLVHAPARTADEMQKAVDNTPGISFDFRDVNVQLREPVSNTNIRLPLWNGIKVHRSGIWSRRI